MRIVIINGNRIVEHSDLARATAERHAATGTTVEVVDTKEAPESVESFVAIHRSAVAILDVIEQVQERADAIVIACFSDPGLFAARELSRVPVIGTAEAAMHLACLVARTFSIIIGRDDRHALVDEVVRLHGFEDRRASIRSISVPVLGTLDDPDDTYARIVEAGINAITCDGAESICLGCAAYSGLQSRLSAELGVPVLDGVASAVKLAEAVVGADLYTSRVGAFMGATGSGQPVASPEK